MRLPDGERRSAPSDLLNNRKFTSLPEQIVILDGVQCASSEGEHFALRQEKLLFQVVRRRGPASSADAKQRNYRVVPEDSNGRVLAPFSHVGLQTRFTGDLFGVVSGQSWQGRFSDMQTGALAPVLASFHFPKGNRTRREPQELDSYMQRRTSHQKYRYELLESQRSNQYQLALSRLIMVAVPCTALPKEDRLAL